MPANLTKANKGQSIGFILRDWVFNDSLVILLSVARELIAAGHDIKFFALDERSDQTFIESASAIAPVHSWSPMETTLKDYLLELGKCKLVISSRAHGAIVSACLGIPVCCVCIEPKLEQVALMLNKGSRAVREPFIKDEIIRLVEEMIEQLPSLIEATVQDVAKNNKEMSNGITLFRSFVSDRASI
jgi:polysaccharide pyruvyl transferase WcaK-like protein